jgi:ribosomal protein S12 methylthiotransferase
MADQGIREINLISQDSTYYGRDLGLKEGLPLLLEGLEKIPNLSWIRVLYSYPEEISDQLLDTMSSDKICSYIDSPFQHAAPTLVRRMRRGLDGTHALELISKIRRRLPDAALRTSLIVGFPGEGPEEFAQLKDFVRQADFDHLGVFTYSHEKDAPSFAWADDIPAGEKMHRRQEIMEIQAGISARRLERYVGTRVSVLLDGRLQGDQDILVGRTQNQAPEVDGVVFISPPEGPGPADVIQPVEILRSDVYDLYGTLI